MTDDAARSEPERRRAYDKGERRRKHVSSGPKAQILSVDGSPRRVEGKCPRDIDEKVRDSLLERAVPLPNADRELPSPKRIYAVLDGVIYEAQTSDHGRTYHAYPYKGKLRDGIVALLRAMAIEDGCLESFETWRKTYITRHGR